MCLYLSEQLVPGPLSLYVAYAGSEGAPIIHHRSITPGYFTTSAVAALAYDSLLTVEPEYRVEG